MVTVSIEPDLQGLAILTGIMNQRAFFSAFYLTDVSHETTYSNGIHLNGEESRADRGLYEPFLAKKFRENFRLL